MSEDVQQLIVRDSLTANEFAVELDGTAVDSVLRVAGLTSLNLSVAENAVAAITEPIEMTKLVERDPESAFNAWVKESVNAKESPTRPTRTLTVVAVDDDVRTLSWTFNGAWISRVGFSAFDSGSAELVEETLTIHYESVDVVWLAS